MTLSSCGNTVRKHDPDRFLLSLFAPPEKREALWALYAFNYEIAKTREVVTETKLGLIRLQWWKDAIVDIYNGKMPPSNDVLESLCLAIREHDLPQNFFDELMYAREFDLEDRLPANLDGMIKYAEFTSVPLLKLGLKISGADAEDANIKNVAAVYSLTGLLRAVPIHARQRRCYLPEDFLNKVGVSKDDLYAGRDVQKLKPVTKAVYDEINKRCHLARREVSQNDKYLQIHLSLAQMYLNQIKRCGYDAFDPRLLIPPLARGLRLWWAAFKPQSFYF